MLSLGMVSKRTKYGIAAGVFFGILIVAGVLLGVFLPRDSGDGESSNVSRFGRTFKRVDSGNYIAHINFKKNLL